MKRVRILLADDHTLMLEALEKLLEPEFDVVGLANDGWTLLRKVEELRPDLVLLDISMSLLNGLDAGRKIRSILPNVKLVYLTIQGDQDYVSEALQLGALGYVLKSSSAADLREAIYCSLKGITYLAPQVRRMDKSSLREPGSREPSRRKIVGLTSRQRQVLQLLAEGRSMKEAAYVLNITARTVAFHKYCMMRDFKIRSNAELFRLAARQHVVA